MGRRYHAQVPTSYVRARSLLRGRASRLVPSLRATTIEPHSAGIALAYHGTPVVVFCEDDTLIINSGGYESMTTKARINDALRETAYSVYQRDHAWYVRHGGGADVPFTNWMRLVPGESAAEFRARLAAEALGAVG